MGKLTPTQRAEIDQIVRSAEYQRGDITTAELARRFGMSWDKMKGALRRAKMKVDAGAPASVTIQQAVDAPQEQKIDDAINYEERDEIKIPTHNADEPELKLVEEPKEQTVLDPNKFYCGVCHRLGRLQEVERSMVTCPGCGGVLKWAN